jgi:hypothetical protein
MIRGDSKHTYFSTRPYTPKIESLNHSNYIDFNFPNAYLKSEQSKDHETKNCECHDFGKLFEGMEKCVDDSL